jgi:ribonucleoside-diphosphate reductase beta chain
METSFSAQITPKQVRMEKVKSPTLKSTASPSLPVKRAKKQSIGAIDELPLLDLSKADPSAVAPSLPAAPIAVAGENVSVSTDPKPTADSDSVVAAERLPEPILMETDDRFVIFPIKHADVWAKYKQHMSVFWTPEEIDLSKDMKDWEKLNENEQHFIKHILGFFAGSDGIVMENLATRFMREVQIPEAKFFYSCQNLLEAIHSETYSLLIDTYITDKAEKTKILSAIQTIPAVKEKADWALAWIDNDEADFGTRLVGFAAVEGIFFSGAFCAIFWLKQRGIMPGLTLSNEFIARDEGLHTDFACLMYSKIVNRLSKEKVHKIIREAVKIEKHFIKKALSCELIGMNAKLMGQYIEFVADRLLLQLGYPKAYRSANPFPFMERISLENKDNFFEKRVSTYAKAMVGKNADDMKFKMGEDF